MSAEVLGRVVGTALAAGALDDFHTPVQMKKNRPRGLLPVRCRAEDAVKSTVRLPRHTTACGVRRNLWREAFLVKSYPETSR